MVEWGAGRGENAEHLGGFVYHAVDVGRGSAPTPFEGVVFSNELFDALPVDVVRVREGVAAMMRVACAGDRFVWAASESVPDAWREYVSQRVAVHSPEEPEIWLELPVRIEETLAAMVAGLTRGFVVSIDYGYTEREAVRFPRGTLMGYRRHQAVEDVLLDPGERDITSHVPFTHLEACAATLGLRAHRLATLTETLLAAGEDDQFAAALAARDESEAQRLRLQLKTLLFGLGETFRTLTLER